jgi:hypothetical protein
MILAQQARGKTFDFMADKPVRALCADAVDIIRHVLTEMAFSLMMNIGSIVKKQPAHPKIRNTRQTYAQYRTNCNDHISFYLS